MNDYETLRKELLDLEDQKNKIMEQAETLLDILNSTGTPPVGLYGNLVDQEGFPRSDVDLYEVRYHHLLLIFINFSY